MSLVLIEVEFFRNHPLKTLMLAIKRKHYKTIIIIYKV